MSENDIEQYISENADKTLRQLQAEIKEDFNVSKSLKWISKVRAKHVVANLEPEETDVEHAPEIIALKTELRQKQLEKEILMAEAEIKEIGEADMELMERVEELESENNLLRKKLETLHASLAPFIAGVQKLLNTPCSTCAGKYITKVNGGYRCLLCGSYLKSPPLRRYI